MLTAKRSSARIAVVDETVHRGHIFLPNGFGLNHFESGARLRTRVGTKDFTASEDRDP
jgi:hypothetical protein